ncbi:type-F conjugative transfer system secretin TraK, partial [Escherichia coli]
MRKNNTAIIFGSLFFSCSVMAANGTLAPTVVPMVNGGQASIAISNTSPNLFTVPGDRIIAVNSLDGALTNNEQTASGGVVVASAGLYGDAHAGLDAKPSLFGVRVDVGAKVGGRASIDGSDLDSHEASSGSRVSHDARHDIDARASKDFKEASDYFTSRKVSESGSHTDNNADSRVDQLSAALNSAKQSYDQYTTNMTRSHEYAEMASRTESMSGQMSEDLSQQFAQYVMKHAPQDAEAILTN